MEKLVVKRFCELSIDELYAILRHRSEIFIVEQDCVYQDLDDMDQGAVHLWIEVDGEMAAYARVLAAGTYLDEVAIGRVIGIRRGQGYGLKIFGHAIDAAVKYYGAKRIKIRSQQQAEHFYEKFGFVRCGEPFMYEGLMHVDMVKENRE